MASIICFLDAFSWFYCAFLEIVLLSFSTAELTNGMAIIVLVRPTTSLHVISASHQYLKFRMNQTDAVIP